MSHVWGVWCPEDEELIPEVEQLIYAHKKARPHRSGSKLRFRPNTPMELDVVVEESGEELNLKAYQDRMERAHIELRRGTQLLRRGDFNVTTHHNPNCRNLPGNHHIHFPTKRYPISGLHTYAYPIDLPAGHFLIAFVEFCKELNVDYEGLDLPFGRWR